MTKNTAWLVLRGDSAVRGIFWVSLLVLVENIQLVIIFGLISIHVPFKADAFNADIFSVYQSTIKPTRQMFIYHLFIMTSILSQISAVALFREKLKEIGFQGKVKKLLCVDALWVAAQLFAVFKILIYNSPSWAWGLLYTSLAASVLSRIFWVEIIRGWDKFEPCSLPLVGSFGEGENRKAILSHPNRTSRIKVEEYLWTPLFIIVESVQVITALSFILVYMKTGSFLLLYAVFIASIAVLSFLVCAKKILIRQIKPFIAAEAIITFFLLSALYKMVIYDYRNQLATQAYHVLLAAAVLNKIAWPGIWSGFRKAWGWVTRPQRLSAVTIFGDILFAAFIIMTIYIPDPQAVLAKMYVGDQFIQTNCFIMSPGWAYIKGCLLDVDVMSRYGLGIPIVLASLAKWAGGYTYLNVFLVILWVTIIYYLLCYLFLRLWLKSFFIAAAAILAGIKTQLFYTLSFPQPFTYPSSIPVRFMLDIIFMLCIWGHLKKRHWGYLLLAAFCCGASFFCVPESGLYLAGAFYAYLILHMALSSQELVKKWVLGLGYGLAVPVSAYILLYSYLGRHLWSPEFWDHLTEISKLYTSGFWMGPFYGGLQYGQFWDLLVGMLFPLVYILTIMIIGTLCVLRKIPEEHLMAVVLGFYGLGAHHYYVVMATANNYWPRGLPFVFIVFYWVGWLLSGFKVKKRRRAGAVLAAFCAYCLWSNHHYLSYPNMFNFSRNPMVDPLVAEELPTRKPYLLHKVWDIPENQKLEFNSLGEKEEGLKRDFNSDEELKEYYLKENDYPKDVRLIQMLVPPQKPVALLSSWETEMLMQADRKPFFYYFRVIQSRPLRMRSLPSLDVWTTKELNVLIDQLKNGRPDYVFMERIFLNDLTPAQYAASDPALMGLLDYVKKHYRPDAYGKFLVAMKRKER